MDFEEPNHIVMLRESLRRFVEAEMPRAAAQAWDADASFKKDLAAEIRFEKALSTEEALLAKKDAAKAKKKG